MKLSGILLITLLVLLVIVSVYIGNTEARKKGGKKVKPGVCKYERKGEDGLCNASNQTKTIILPLRKGDPATCQPSKIVMKPCSDYSLVKKKKLKGCKYERKGSEWTECDANTNERTKVMKLKDDSNADCPTTRTKTKSCGGGKKKGSRSSRKDA